MPNLRQSTVGTLIIGPAMSNDTGTLPLTNLTIVPGDVMLSKDGGAFAAKNHSGTAVHGTRGQYHVVIDATDTNTLGRLYYDVTNGTALPMWGEYQVIEASKYDWLNGTNSIEQPTGGTVDLSVQVNTGTVLRANTVGTTERANSTPTNNPTGGTVDLAVAINTNGDKTGYSVSSGSVDLAVQVNTGTVLRAVTVGTAERVNSAPSSNPTGGTVDLAVAINTNNDKTGYAVSSGSVDLSVIVGTTFSQQLVDDIWDEPLTGVAHNVNTSSGRRLREVASDVILSGTTPSSNDRISIQLDANASAIDRTYDPAVITIVAGTGIGQSRQIWEYNGTTKTAYINRNWATIPSDDAEYIITSDSGDTHVNEGLVVGATGTSITLNALASEFDDIYVGQYAFISAGTGADDNHRIVSYNGTTKVAVINSTWHDMPVANESVYAILPSDNPTGGTADYVINAGTLLQTLSRGEPGQGAPAATTDSFTKNDYLYKAFRNKKDNNGTESNIYNDAGDTVDHKSTVSSPQQQLVRL
jgi:hypothetical protein